MVSYTLPSQSVGKSSQQQQQQQQQLRDFQTVPLKPRKLVPSNLIVPGAGVGLSLSEMIIAPSISSFSD